MKLKNSRGINVGKHYHACYGTPHCSESSEQRDLAKSSETNKLLQKEVQYLAARYSKHGFTPTSFFLATIWRSLRRWCCSA